MNELLRKNKNKLVASIAVIGLGITAASMANGDGENEKQKQPAVTSSVSVSATETVGGTDTGWDHGAAERAIEEGLKKAAAMLYVNGIDFTEKFDELPTYDNAMKAVEILNEENGMLRSGAKISVSTEVTADSEGNVSYEVTDAKVIDTPNNQK